MYILLVIKKKIIYVYINYIDTFNNKCIYKTYILYIKILK